MLTFVSASKADNRDSFAIFDGEDCIGHIMRTQKSPEGEPWFWTIFVGAVRGIVSDRGYAATREQAIADFEVEWLRLSVLKNKRAPKPKWSGLSTYTRPERYAADSYPPSCFQNVNPFIAGGDPDL